MSLMEHFGTTFSIRTSGTTWQWWP